MLFALLLAGCAVFDPWIPRPDYYPDRDGDGFGDGSQPADRTCSGQPSGFALDSSDCNDAPGVGFAINPGVDEVCDGVDNNCDGVIDESMATDASLWYADADGDGFGDPAGAVTACGAPDGYVADATDCDDTNAEVNTGGVETCNGLDDNCDGNVDEGFAAVVYADTDGDGYGDPGTGACGARDGYVSDDTDCDDTNAAINTSASEVCDGVDNNCDGTVDESTATDATIWYPDADGDGYGDAYNSQPACTAPDGTLADGTDCDDTKPAVNPAAIEVCDGVDNNCDGFVDESTASDASIWYYDSDGDGFGDASISEAACAQPAGYTSPALATDCDDTNAAVSPAATEICDGVDNDCDALIDDADPSLDITTATSWYLDGDADGYGLGTAVIACTQPAGTAPLSGDCDDTDPAYNPGAVEADCTDPHDYNCDGSTGYADADGDGYAACKECDDSNSAINPAAIEVCDGVDNNCDGAVDEATATDAGVWYADADHDGYGDVGTPEVSCDAGAGYVLDSTDCDDTDSSVYPNAPEKCDGVDHDCDTLTYENDSTDAVTWYADVDTDGYGNASSSTKACFIPSGYVADSTDCDDTNIAVNPAAPEVCNTIDDDCDGHIDDDDSFDPSTGTVYYPDTDGDGYGDPTSSVTMCVARPAFSVDNTDCDDTSNIVYPSAPEVCDDVDNDCNSVVDDDPSYYSTWYADADGDGYGDATTSTTACDQPGGYVSGATDCLDSDSSVHPAATEIAGDGIDQNCDGVDNVYFLAEDFESYTVGNAPSGGCWRITGDGAYDGRAYEKVTALAAHAGANSLDSSSAYASGLFCDDTGFNSDFTFDGWLYDDASSGGDYWSGVAFAGASASSVTNVLMVGWVDRCDAEKSAANYMVLREATGAAASDPNCGDGGVAATTLLGGRSVGWHEITGAATYAGTSDVIWKVCVDHVCTAEETTTATVESFHFIHNGVSGYFDDFYASNGAATNTAPSEPTATLTPSSPTDSDPLVCAGGASVDADGDVVNYTYAWTVDGTSAGVTGGTVPAASTLPGQVWACTATATDGVDDSSPSASVSADPIVASACVNGEAQTLAGGNFAKVCASTFEMGCTAGSGLDTGECSAAPEHSVTLTHDYYASQTEATRGDFAAMLGYDPSSSSSCTATDCPVENVTWYEAAAYANAVSDSEGLTECYACAGSGTTVTCTTSGDPYTCEGYRLLTEAEWEGAARCGQDEEYAGSTVVDGVAWISNNSGGESHAVGGKTANECGLYDLSGNVQEWTQGWDAAGTADAVVDPAGAASGSYIEFRGGNYGDGSANARVAYRNQLPPGARHGFVGFRLARTIP